MENFKLIRFDDWMIDAVDAVHRGTFFHRSEQKFRLTVT